MGTMTGADTQAAENAGEPYEAPRVEMVLTAEDLEQEVLYAGGVSLKTE